MPAHIRSIEAVCAYGGCARRATVEVYTTWNDPVGKFCKPHGEKRATELRAADERAGR